MTEWASRLTVNQAKEMLQRYETAAKVVKNLRGSLARAEADASHAASRGPALAARIASEP